MDRPLVSVITVVYNAITTFESTIKSVVSQDKSLFEYWIIDGGSTDGSIDIIRKYEHHLAGWVSEKDKGIFDAMNKGIQRAKGNWIYFLGADDALQTNILATIAHYLTNDYKIVFGDVLFDNNHIMRSYLGLGTLMQNTLHHQGAFYHYSLFEDFQYDQSLPIQADYELNLRTYLRGASTKYVPVLVSTYALGGNSAGYTEKSYNEINLIRSRHLKGTGKNLIISSLLRLYWWQKQFRFWLYGHRI